MKKQILNMFLILLLGLGCSKSNPVLFTASASASGRSYVYALGNTSTSIFGYSVDSSGALTAINTTTINAVGFTGIKLKAAPSKKFLYATVNAGPSFKLVALEVNQASGATSLVTGGSDDITDNNPSDLVIHPNSSIAYIPDSAADRVGIFTLNATTGVPTEVGNGASGAGTAPTGVAIHPNGNFLYVVENGAVVAVTGYSINTTSGALVALVGPGSTHQPGGVSLYKAAFSPDGKWLYVSGDSDVHVYSVNATTGAIAHVETEPLVLGGLAEGDSLTVDGNSEYLYVSNVPNGDLDLLSLFQSIRPMAL